MVNRLYLKNKIHEITNDKNIISACKKIEQMYNIPYYVIYNFTRKGLPTEDNFIKIIKSLNLDFTKLFII